MAIKMVVDASFTATNLVEVNEGSGWKTYSENPETILKIVRADAEWRRPRPSPLRDTPMLITKRYQNGGKYGPRSTSVIRRTGTVSHVYYDSTVRTSTESDDGAGAFNRALAGFSEFSFGETLVEAKQTASMLTKRGDQLDRIGLALLRGDKRALERAMGVGISLPTWRDLMAMSASRRLAQGYNEVSYGWMPVLQAISDGARAYVRGLGGKGDTRRVRRGGNRTPFSDDFSKPLPPPSGGATVSGVIRNPHLANANQLGLLNVPLEIWNKVPYSFVFDWAIPIATYLGGITATAGLEHVRACRTSVTRTTVKLRSPTGVERVYEYREEIARMPQSPTPILAGLAHGSAVTFGKVVSSYMLARAGLLRR